LEDRNKVDNQESSGLTGILRKVVDVRPGELRALALGFLYYFLILSSYYILRPIRDTFGLEGGVENLASMFTGSLLVLLIANTVFSSLVAKHPRRRFIPIAYRFFIFNILIFFVLLHFIPPKQSVWVGRAFFIWVSVFNLFVLSVFWAFMVDVFTTEQGKRLFGFISVGGTLGAILGAAITAKFVDKLGVLNLLLVSAVLVELSAQCVRFFPRPSETELGTKKAASAEAPVGGGVWAGLVHNLKSPYLIGISIYMLLYSITSTLLYFQQAGIVNSIYTARDARTALFAQIDLIVNILTLFVQIFLTGKLLKWFGVGATLAILPALSVVGFLSLGVTSTLTLLVIFVTCRRAANFALARPARETLFTVITREDKYKAKNFIDTIVYRTGDQLGAWTDKLLKLLGLGLREVSLVAAPVAAIWLLVSLWLGRRQKERQAAAENEHEQRQAA
jgi:ATP:ADP antiporter, AAA family